MGRQAEKLINPCSGIHLKNNSLLSISLGKFIQGQICITFKIRKFLFLFSVRD